MDPRAFTALGRRLASQPSWRALVDESAEAIRRAVSADVLLVAVRASDSNPPIVRVAGAASPLDGLRTVETSSDGVQSLLTRHGFPIQTVVGLDDELAGDGLVVAGWREQAAVPPDHEAALELATHQLTVAVALAKSGRLASKSHASPPSAQLHMLSEIASGVAHDVNNALTTIVGTTEWLLKHETLSEDAQEDLTHMRMAATDAAFYVRRLLDAAREVQVRQPHRSGARPPGRHHASEDGAVDLARVAHQLPRLSRARWAPLIARGLDFDFVVDASTASPVHGSAPELRELLLNLVFNAVDAMHDRGGRLSVRVSRVDSHVEIAVSDTGTGIAPQVRPHIFEPLYTTKGRRGSGLGLSICHEIARAHGGTLRVDSEVGEGTTVTLALPAVADASAAPPPAVRPGQPRATSTQHVLLVEDQPDVRDSVCDMLTTLGHRVVAAHDGETALELLARHPVTLVLTDLSLPRMDGLEVARHVKQRDLRTPVVLMTGWGDDGGKCPESIDVVLPKPPTLDALQETIARAVGGVAA